MWGAVPMNERRPGEEAPDLDIGNAVELFIARNRPNWKGETSRTYRKSLATFEEFAADEGLDTLSDLEQWKLGGFQDWLLHSDFAQVTVQSKQKQSRRWLKWLGEQGYIGNNIYKGISPLELDQKEQTSSDVMRAETIRRFLMFFRNSVKWRATRGHALLEVIGHTGARRSCIRALDLDDYDPNKGTLLFLNRSEKGTRLKQGDSHQRKVVLSEEPNEVLHEYIKRERYKRHDDTGRQPLFTSMRGRPTKSTITNWLYEVTLPCNIQECPHSRQRHTCQWTAQQKACQCPSSTSPHPIRRGSITWQLNLGSSIEKVAKRAGTTPSVIRRYYDQPNFDEDLRRRIADFDSIDVCKHGDPTDLDEDVDS